MLYFNFICSSRVYYSSIFVPAHTVFQFLALKTIHSRFSSCVNRENSVTDAGRIAVIMAISWWQSRSLSLS